MAKLKARDAVLDMEAVVLDEHGKSGFQNLQAALGEGGHREQIAAFTFDLLYLDGLDYTKKPLIERKAALAALLQKSKAGKGLVYSDHFAGDGAGIFKKSCALGLEGVVSKRADAPYTAGRDRNWLKSKCIQRQEFVIVGYSDARSGDRALGALYLAYYAEGRLKYAGKVGTGFTMKSARDLAGRFTPLATGTPVLPRAETTGMSLGEYQGVHWLTPKLLCEISFTEWTGDGRIRHPSFQGLREDKHARDVRMEKPAMTNGRTSGDAVRRVTKKPHTAAKGRSKSL
jgi:bifunctional non-homologous end joining protein LigD